MGRDAIEQALGRLNGRASPRVEQPSDGLSDREIADRLFLSPRTVGSHLYRSYPSVASRHQLRDVIAQTSRSPAQPSSVDVQ